MIASSPRYGGGFFVVEKFIWPHKAGVDCPACSGEAGRERPGAWACLGRHDQADTKIDISSLALTEGEEVNVLRGKIQMDDAYLGEEHPDGKTAGGGSGNKTPVLETVTGNEAGPSD